MIPDSFKQDLLNRVDIVDVVSRYVQLKKGGANFQGLCPFHSEKTPSFTVSPAKQFYHCFGCGAHGNAIGFLMAYGGPGLRRRDQGPRLRRSACRCRNRSRAPRRRSRAREREHRPLRGDGEARWSSTAPSCKKSPRAIEYLKGRGLTGEIAARFRIGYAPDGWQGLKDAFRELRATSRSSSAGLVIEATKASATTASATA